VRNGTREALIALKKTAQTTKTSVLSPFELIMKEIGGLEHWPLVKDVCATCGNHDFYECTSMMFPGTDFMLLTPSWKQVFPWFFLFNTARWLN
jgi:hypothetical protein